MNKKNVKPLREDAAESLLSFAEDKGIKTAKIAKDAMIKPVLLYPDDNVERIIKKLKKENTNVCVVVTNDKEFIGEIGVEDLIKLFLHQVKYEPLVKILNIGYRREFLHLSAKELINKHKSTVKLKEPLNNVIKLIHKEGFNYIPVLDENKRVLGVVTPSSLINFLKNE